jgi:hypothetical protein
MRYRFASCSPPSLFESSLFLIRLLFCSFCIITSSSTWRTQTSC